MIAEYADEVLVAIAARVRAYRKERGLTQLELASRAGLAEGTVSRFEKSREPPTLSSLLRIAAALDVSIEDLVTSVPQPTVRPSPSPHEREQRQLVDLVSNLDRQAVRQLLGLARLLSDRSPAPQDVGAGTLAEQDRAAPASVDEQAS